MILDFLFHTLVALIVGWFLKFLWHRRKLYVLSLKLSGPAGLPLIGVGYKFVCPNERILGKLKKLIDQYESPMGCWLGPQFVAVFKDPESVEAILTSNELTEKHDVYQYMQPLLGNGLITSSGATHKAHRKIIQPLIGHNFVSACLPIFQSQLSVLIENLEKRVEQGMFNIERDIHHCISDIIGHTLLGTKLDSQRGKNLEFVHALLTVQDASYSMIVKPWWRLTSLLQETTLGRKASRCIALIHKVLDKQIESAIEASESGVLNGHKVGKMRSLVYELVLLTQKYPKLIGKSDLIWHMSTLHAASDDTITLNVSFACLCFGFHSEYQEKAAKEIYQHFGKGSAEISYSDLSKLKYLEMCIKEIFRLFPIGPYILRRFAEDTRIGDITYPEGCAILIPIYNIHRDPKYWLVPDDFYPDHFLPENAKMRPSYAYIPFSGGSRSCAGKIFAYAAMKYCLVRILQNFVIEADGQLNDVPLRADISVRTINGCNVRLNKRIWV